MAAPKNNYPTLESSALRSFLETDFFLEKIIAAINTDESQSMQVTLNIEGLVISGKAIHGLAWIKKFEAQWPYVGDQPISEFSQVFAHIYEPGADRLPGFVHLEDARRWQAGVPSLV
jgi:hypothetical protein